MKKKRFSLRPGLVNYFGAIANAVNIEHADNSRLASFLNVASDVIELETPARAVQFFKSSRVFFQYHALYYDRTFRLYARDDDYAFEYIKPLPGLGSIASLEPLPESEETTEPVPEKSVCRPRSLAIGR